MNDFKNFKKLTAEKFVKYYNKNFVDNNAYNSLYEKFKDASINLARVHICFAFLVESIDMMKNDKNFYNNLPEAKKEMLEEYRMCNEYISNKLCDILDFIKQGLMESYK